MTNLVQCGSQTKHDEEGGRISQRIQRLFRLGLQQDARVESRHGKVKAVNLTWQEAIETATNKVCTKDHVEDRGGDRKAA